MGLRPFPQAFHDSSQFFVGCEDNGIDGKNDSPSVLQDIGGMDVERYHPIQIPVGESAAVPDAETGKGIEPSCAEVAFISSRVAAVPTIVGCEVIRAIPAASRTTPTRRMSSSNTRLARRSRWRYSPGRA